MIFRRDGKFSSRRGRTALERFAEKCAFDPITGCVMWIAGTTAGQGHSQRYGRFNDGEKVVLAHRWSAEHIHGFAIDGLQVDHWCPAGQTTLCVEHVKPETAEMNRFLQANRPAGRAWQCTETRRHWIHVQVGIVTLQPIERIEGFDMPFFLPPAWLAPFLPEISDVPPF